MKTAYKFLISDGTTTKQVVAHYKELKKSFSKESAQQFFRVSLDGTITVFKDDFDFISSKDINTEFIFSIVNASDESVYYKGKFTKTDCKFDYFRKKCELKLKAVDQYEAILDKYSNTYDLLKLKTPPAITSVDMYKRPLVQVYIRGANTISNFISNTYWESEVSSVVDSGEDLINKYHFAFIKYLQEFNIVGGSNKIIFAGSNGSYSSNGASVELELFKGIGDSFSESDKLVKGTVYNLMTGTNDEANIGNDDYILKNIYKFKLIIGSNSYRSTDSFTIPNETSFYISDVFNTTTIYFRLTSWHIENITSNVIYQRLLHDMSSVNNEGSVFQIPYDDFAITKGNYNYCSPSNIGEIYYTTVTSDEPTKYGINDFGKYFTNTFISLTAAQGRPMPVCRSFWGNSSIWYVKTSMYETLIDQVYRKKFTVKDTYNIAAIIKALLNEIDPTLQHEATEEYSQFLYSARNPLPNIQRFYVFLSQKSNILKGEYDQPAQKAEITFESLMNMLRDCFRCYWFIEDGKFKIEHIRYFLLGRSYTSMPSSSYDLTAKLDAFNKKRVLYAQREISYDKSELSARYEFSWADDSTEAFSGQNININANYIQKDKTDDIAISDFSSDVDYMLLNPDNFSEDGFALLCPILYNGIYTLPIINDSNMVDQEGIRYESYIQNYYASWRNLINFYMYDLPAYGISIDTFPTSALRVYSIKKCMTHDIEFTPDRDINEFDIIKTDIGDGSISSFKVNIDTKRVEATLSYNPI